MLLISALCCLAVLVVARLAHRPLPGLEQPSPARSDQSLSRAFWLYLAAGALMAAGFADFSLIAFHFQKTATVPQGLIPVFYAIAMATGAITALVLGALLDRDGLPVLLIGFGLSAFFAVLVFLRDTPFELIGIILWGIGMGAQDACLKAALSAVIPSEMRSTGFGIFDTGFGMAWFAGSAIMGLKYERSIPALIIFSILLQLAALPVFRLAHRQKQQVAA